MAEKRLLLISVGHTYNDMYFYLFPLLLPFFRLEFDLNYAQVGLLMTVFMATVAIFSSVWGSLGDKMGHHRLLCYGFVVATLGLFLVTFTSHFRLIVLLVALTSIGVSTFHPLATTMISFSKNRPGFSMGVFEASGTVGGIVATVMMSLLINSWGWRWTVVLLALPGLWLAYLFYQKVTLTNQTDQTQIVKRPTASKTLLLFFTGRTIRGLGAGAVLSFLPSTILEAWQLSPDIGSLVYATFFVGGLAGSLLLGHLADRVSQIGLVTLTTLLPVLLIYLITQNLVLPVGILLIFLTGACFTGFFPPHNRWIADGIPHKQRGRYFGLGMTLETFAFAISPGLLGLFADYAGLMPAFRSTTLMWLVSGLCFAYIFGKRKQPVEQRSN